MKNKKLLVVAVLLAGISVGSAFATVGIGIGPQYNDGAGSGVTILFNEKMVVNIGFAYNYWSSYATGLGLGFDYLIGQYDITDFGSGGVVEFGWHWGIGGALHMYFPSAYVDDRFGFAIGALPIIGLDLDWNITSDFKLGWFLQYQPVLGLIVNRPGFGRAGHYEDNAGFWFNPSSFAVGVRFHF